VVFTRENHTYLIMTETADGGGDWNSFLPQLSQFYRGMEFYDLAPLPVDYELAKVLDSSR
jgi:hypothetical protein